MDAQNICRTCLKLSDCEFEKKPCNTNIREFCDFIGPENLTIGEIIKLITSIEVSIIDIILYNQLQFILHR